MWLNQDVNDFGSYGLACGSFVRFGSPGSYTVLWGVFLNEPRT